jgi:hypothetical protein
MTISDKRLTEILARVSPPHIGWQVGLETVEIHAIITELQSRRASSPKPLEITEGRVRAELENMDAAGCLVTYQTDDDRGITVDEYVSLIMGVISSLNQDTINAEYEINFMDSRESK